MQVGDFVKGKPNNGYSITNEHMTKAIVTAVDGDQITVEILEHSKGMTGRFMVNACGFAVIGHVKPFDRDAVIAILRGGNLSDLLEYDLRGADLSGSDLRGANLSCANLSGSDLRGANLRCANLSRADLRDADLRGANLSGSDLRGANLSCANLSGADLSDADLSGANLSQVKNLMSSIRYIDANFERVVGGYVAYKTFGGQYDSPESWRIEKGAVIEETVNFDRCTECGSGINVAPLSWVKSSYNGNIWKVLIRFEWLAGVCVPYMTDGKIRCERVELLEVVK